MRSFTLWDSTRSSSYSLTAINGLLVTSVEGLGVAVVTSRLNKAVSDYQFKFEDVVLGLSIGAGVNGYTGFDGLAAFIASNGKAKFILQYSFNNVTRYCDVWITKLSKGQLNDYRRLDEKLSMERVSHWYELVSASVPTSPDAQGIVNSVFEEIPVDMIIVGPTTGTVRVLLKQGTTVLNTVELIGTLATGEEMHLDANAKTVKLIASGMESNAYHRINHAYDTFLMVPQGTCNVNLVSGTTSGLTVTYRKWVLS